MALKLILGDIRTQEYVGAQASAMVIEDDRIVFVGTQDAALLVISDSPYTLQDYGNYVVLPGFIDSHIHFLAY